MTGVSRRRISAKVGNGAWSRFTPRNQSSPDDVCWYAQSDIPGHVQDKPTWMAEYFRLLAALTKTGKFRWERCDERDVRVVSLGDTAVVTGELGQR